MQIKNNDKLQKEKIKLKKMEQNLHAQELRIARVQEQIRKNRTHRLIVIGAEVDNIIADIPAGGDEAIRKYIRSILCELNIGST